MNSFRVFSRQARRIVVTVAMLVASILPALTPALASADQVTTRSIALSSSVADASSVTYQVNFTSIQAAGAVVIDFCDDSPLLGSTCSAPSGFTVSGATPSAGFTKVGADTTASKITLTGTIGAASDISFTLSGVHNPTAAGPLYARIVTYVDGTAAHDYTSTVPGTHLDDGGIALSMTDKIAVSAAVLESMTFCVSGEDGSQANPITENCGGTLFAPVLKLGQDTGGVISLDSGDVYTGAVYTQLSTNASSGAIVSLKSNATGCGGLIRAGAASPSAGCGIAPALAAGITAGQAKFGVKTATATGSGSNFNGTFRPYDSGSGAYYSNSVYKMNWVSGDASGVTGTYGDPLLDTNGAPVNNMDMALTFGASAANNTPAGLYSADLNLIATGKF
jgi:hypothetical protein